MGLRGEQIPLCGRIVAVSDVYDAPTTARVYKPAFTHEVARGIIIEGRGKHFDPVIVDAFLDIEEKFLGIKERFTDVGATPCAVYLTGQQLIASAVLAFSRYASFRASSGARFALPQAPGTAFKWPAISFSWVGLRQIPFCPSSSALRVLTSLVPGFIHQRDRALSFGFAGVFAGVLAATSLAATFVVHVNSVCAFAVAQMP